MSVPVNHTDFMNVKTKRVARDPRQIFTVSRVYLGGICTTAFEPEKYALLPYQAGGPILRRSLYRIFPPGAALQLHGCTWAEANQWRPG